MKKGLVSVIIPHYNGVSFIDDCLRSLGKTTHKPIEIIVVDNGSTDGSQRFIHKKYPQVKVLQTSRNLGYAGGCTYGFEHSIGEFVVFLNNDTTVDKDWLTAMVKQTQKKDVAICQPKVLALRQPTHFEYAGAAGGYMDKYGYPFCRGRVFTVCEKDEGQYDQTAEIFWASGVCLFAKRKILEEIGAFDPLFFTYYEEEDLCWRAHLRGYKVVCVPQSTIYHYGEKTAGKYPFKKYYYLHRNHTVLLLKNYALSSLLKFLPGKFLLDLAMLPYFLFKGEVKRTLAVLAACLWLPFHVGTVLAMRKKTQRLRTRSEEEILSLLYPKSIVMVFFVKKKKLFSEL